MCGIAGFYQFNDKKDRRVNILKKMLTRIKHRGPDESGIYLSDKIGLGSVRLSIIDLKTGTMPLSNEDESLWIVFNGEIYNYIELRAELVLKGHSFKTDSDTEVIIHLYEEYGVDFLNKLNGQFAIAIWDTNENELFLARDRVGIRPLYYTEVDASFIFASEMKSFLEYPKIKFSLSPKSLSQFFTFWTALSPNTVFDGIFELPPGSYLTLNKNGKTIRRYWEIPIYKENNYTYTNIDEAIVEFDTLFHDAVKLRLRADVPVVAYLSGGLDSSVTTSYIKKISPKKLQTFSIKFSDKDFDESMYQDIASEYFGTNHSSISCTPVKIAENFKNVIWHVECPLLRTSAVSMGSLAKKVRDHGMKVVITGEGADELLGGYNIFKETKIRHFWAKDPQSAYRPLLLKKLYPYLPQMKGATSNVLKMFFGYKLNETSSPIYSHLLRWNNTSRIKNYLSEENKYLIKDYNPINEFEKQLESKLEGYDYLSKAQWIEIELFMSGYLLSSQGDRMGMASSVENRYPFLDHRIIEFCMKLHPDLKLNGLNEKYLLKKMMKGLLPSSILERPKQAYRAPIANVFISNEIPKYLKEISSDRCLTEFGIFNVQYVNRLIEKMKKKTEVSEVDNMALAGILSTQILYDLFIKRSIPKLKAKDIVVLDKLIIDN